MSDDDYFDRVADRIDPVLEDKLENIQNVAQSDSLSDDLATDPVYSHFALDRQGYITAITGNSLITSVTRNLGTIYEKSFRFAIGERYGINSDSVDFSVTVEIQGEQEEKEMDAKLLLEDVPAGEDREAVRELMRKYASQGGYDPDAGWEGFGVEVRQCYRTNDAERLQKNKRSGKEVEERNLLPMMVIFCDLANQNAVQAWDENWVILEGQESYDFTEELTGFDLHHYLESRSEQIDDMMEAAFG